MFLYLCLAPRTCQVPKIPKTDQGEGMKREKWKAGMRNSVRGGVQQLKVDLLGIKMMSLIIMLMSVYS